MDDLILEFLTETSESLAVLDVELVKLEQDPNDSEILGNIFRLMHTIKGTCGFLGLPRLEKVAHAGEDVLGKFRDGALEVSPEAVTLILTCIDCIRDLLAALEQTGEEPHGDDEALIASLRAMAAGQVTPPSAAEQPTSETAETDEGDAAAAPVADTDNGGPVLSEEGFPMAAELLAEVEAAVATNATAEEEAPQSEAAAEEDVAPQAEAAVEASTETAEPVAESSPEEPAVPSAQVPAVTPSKSKAVEAGAPADDSKGANNSTVAAQSIRVNVDVLEDLMTMVSELVLTRNNLLQMIRGHDDSEFAEPLQRLSLITTDLQEGVMKTRMQPIGNAWAKLPRIVRDLAVETGKKLELKMLGADTELDRQVLELIKDPLTHMVRNSADHGVEGPEERLAAGKSETGTVTLNAYHEGGHIIIEIADDGKGLNTDRIKQKVIDNGLASEAELEAMTDQQIHQHIFKAGFSTAEKVTSVSGRGVGMDVVRTNIEKIGGTVELKSVQGEGSVFTIKIPLTLAIVSALIVACSEERFAIPQISVRELVHVSPQSENAVEWINEAPVLRLRNRLLPLVILQDLLGIGGEALDIESRPYFVVVTQVGPLDLGIIVDQVFDTEEIVVKPVARVLREIPYYSGNTILGDGSVIMILDPNGIATNTGQSLVTASKDVEAVSDHGRQLSVLLIFRAGGDERKAVPMTLVARLEHVDMAAVERVSGRPVVQYRGHLMPLVSFDPNFSWPTEGEQSVLVFSDDNRSMGLVVDEIVDIIETRLEMDLSSEQPGIVGSAIIDGMATDVIDAAYYLTQAFEDWFGSDGGIDESRANIEGRRLLLVDDSQFFLNLLSPRLSLAGFKVTTAANAKDALKLRDEGIGFDVIVSDIEMPDMDGFTFAEAVHGDPRWGSVPMIALSSANSRNNIERGKEVGFAHFVPKTHRDDLIRTLHDTLQVTGEAA